MQSLHILTPREQLRKKYGHEIADRLMAYWNHFNIDDPASKEEVIFFYILGERVEVV